MVNWTSILPFKATDNLQFVNLWTLPEAIPRRRRRLYPNTETTPMPVAVIAVSMLVMLMVTTPSAASPSCMSKSEARQHFGLVHIYWHGQDHCWDATPTRRYHQIHQVQRTTDQPKWQDSMSEMLPVDEPVQTTAQPTVQPTVQPTWADRWANVELTRSPVIARWVDIPQVAPLSVIERKPEPEVTPRSVVLVFIAIVLMLGTIEVLFRCSIYEHSGKDTPSAG